VPTSELAPLRPAATVVVLRPGPEDGAAEILLLKRSRKVGFFPRAWVFPGGRLDPEDHTLDADGEVPGLRPEHRAFAVAATRECFEECGLWLGTGTPSSGLRNRLLDTRQGIVASDGIRPDLRRLRQWGWWATPEVEKRRYDTRFFVARVTREESKAATHDARETVDSEWATAEVALQKSVSGEMFMAPPTWRTLQEMSTLGSATSIWQAARHRPVPCVMPVLRRTDEGVDILLPGHESHPEPVHPVHVPHSRSICWRDGRWRDV